MVDAVIAGATRMKVQGFAPDIVVFREVECLSTQLGKGTDGHYLASATLLRDAGLRIALSASVTAGKALLIDPQYVGYLGSGSTRVAIGYINDGVAKNMATVRGETDVLPYLTDCQAALPIIPSPTWWKWGQVTRERGSESARQCRPHE